MNLRVLGIDPGTIRMGFGLLDTNGMEADYATCGVIQCSRTLSLSRRLWKIYQELLEIIESWRPQVVAIEEPFVPLAHLNNPEFTTSVRSVMAIGQSVAIALLASTAMEVPTFQYTPTQVKKAVSNYGRGSKEQVQEAVRLTLRLAQPPEPLDASDALAVALCHLQYQHISDIQATATTGTTPITGKRRFHD